MAAAAVLAGLHVFHGHDRIAFFHLEEAGLVAISALVAFICVDFAVEDHLAGALAVKLESLARRNSESRSGKNERYNEHDRYN